MKTLIVIAALAGGCTEPSNVKDLRNIYRHIEENRKYPTQEEWSEKIRKQSEDPDLPQNPDLKLSAATLEKIIENPFTNRNCYTCDEYLGDDPNMRNE